MGDTKEGSRRLALSASTVHVVDNIERDLDFAQPRRIANRASHAGAQGCVCLVSRSTTQEKAARKNIHQHLQAATLEPGTNYAVAELRLLQAVSGIRHLPTFLGAAEDQQFLYMFYRPWCAYTLRDWLNSPTKAAGQKWTVSGLQSTGAQWMLCLAAAVHSLHSLSPPVMHRDVKPENLCVTEEGQLVLVDLGVGRFCADSTVCSTYVGTEQYMAPEVRAGRPYGRTSEVFSIGCVFSELLTVMFGCNVQTGLLAAIRNDPFSKKRNKMLKFLATSKPSDGSLDTYVELVEKMTSPRPVDRPALWEVHKKILESRESWVCCGEELSFEDDKLSDKELTSPESADTDELIRQIRRLSL